jgi:TonB family protein
VDSTTGQGGFDQEVREQVKQWKFDAIPAGNTTVTIPFTFAE